MIGKNILLAIRPYHRKCSPNDIRVLRETIKLSIKMIIWCASECRYGQSAKVQSAKLRQCLDGRRKRKKKSLTFCGTGPCHHQYYTPLKNKFLGETMLLSCACHPCAKEGHNTTADDGQTGKSVPYPLSEIHTAELIHTEYTFSGGASDSVP